MEIPFEQKLPQELLENFHRRHTSPDGRCYICKSCEKVRRGLIIVKDPEPVADIKNRETIVLGSKTENCLNEIRRLRAGL